MHLRLLHFSTAFHSRRFIFCPLLEFRHTYQVRLELALHPFRGELAWWKQRRSPARCLHHEEQRGQRCEFMFLSLASISKILSSQSGGRRALLRCSWCAERSQSETHGCHAMCGPLTLSRVFQNSWSLIDPRPVLETSLKGSDVVVPYSSPGMKPANSPGTKPANDGQVQRPGPGGNPSRESKFLAGNNLRWQGPNRISAIDIPIITDPEDDGYQLQEALLPQNSFDLLKSELEALQRGFSNIPESIRHIPKMDPHGVYANYNLRLDHIKVYGFDYDYTLAHYSGALQPLIYDLALKHLVTEYRYPESCLKFKYEAEFPIRGLYYDKKNGNLLKLDFFHSVEPHSCFFGRRRLSSTEIEEQYGGKHISTSYIPNLVPLMDLFCFSEACLISDIIQHFVDQNMEFDSKYVYDDIKRSIDWVHGSGLMHRTVLSDPSTYLVKNPAVIKMLRRLKEKGKKLFILTNSPYPFLNGGMRYLFQEDGHGGDTWRELFDVVLASADKPAFYTSERPFRHYSTKTDMLGFSKVNYFGEHAVYYHGCLKAFLDITKWRGTEVIYCGDHLYTDLRGPAKAGWRTAAIIRELEKEILQQNKIDYRIQQAKYNVVQELLGNFHKLPEETQQGEEPQKLLVGLRLERQGSRIAMRSLFNKYFGSCFLTDTGKESAFAYNVQRYADIYTSRLDNLMAFSSEPWLYTPFDVKSLPHNIKVSPSTFMEDM